MISTKTGIGGVVGGRDVETLLDLGLITIAGTRQLLSVELDSSQSSIG